VGQLASELRPGRGGMCCNPPVSLVLTELRKGPDPMRNSRGWCWLGEAAETRIDAIDDLLSPLEHALL
jgi:hypothetical protein